MTRPDDAPDQSGSSDADMPAADMPADFPLDEAALTALLASLPPLTMPHEVADRIDAAIAGAAPVTSSQVVRPLRRWAVPLTVAASVVVLGLVAAVLLRPHPPTVVVISGPVLSSGTDYTEANLAFAGTELLEHAGLIPGWVPQELEREAPADPAELVGTFASSPAGLTSCVDGVTELSSVEVVAVDVAEYAGQPAAVVILRSSESTHLDVTAVSLTCQATDPAVIDQAQITF